MAGAARDAIERLRLERHPEGGWYRETWRAAQRVRGRSVATAILYLLEASDRSRFHRLASDEAWFHQAGDAATLHLLGAGGHRRLAVSAEQPQTVIPAGTWFGATVDRPGAWALCGCVVAPGFEFADLEMARRGELARAFPDDLAIVERLTAGDDDA